MHISTSPPPSICKGTTSGLMLCCCQLEILNNDFTRNPQFSFCTGPPKLCGWFCQPCMELYYQQVPILEEHLLGFCFHRFLLYTPIPGSLLLCQPLDVDCWLNHYVAPSQIPRVGALPAPTCYLSLRSMMLLISQDFYPSFIVILPMLKCSCFFRLSFISHAQFHQK